jgi:hypothetical protein
MLIKKNDQATKKNKVNRKSRKKLLLATEKNDFNTAQSFCAIFAASTTLTMKQIKTTSNKNKLIENKILFFTTHARFIF